MQVPYNNKMQVWKSTQNINVFQVHDLQKFLYGKQSINLNQNKKVFPKDIRETRGEGWGFIRASLHHFYHKSIIISVKL